ncbi:MAG: xylose isomerase, partial [Spirochaetota bacterium]
MPFRDGAERFAATIRDETGLRTGFHHHWAGFVETPGEIEKLPVSTSPDLLGVVLGTGHCAFACGSPEAALKLFGQRWFTFTT